MKSNSGLFSLCHSDEDIISIMEENGYDLDVCEVGIKFLKTQKNIHFVLEKTGYASNVCKVGIPLIKSE